MEALWGVMTILGPVLLLAALTWAMVRNRQQRMPESQELTERATRELYEQLDSEDKQKDR
jgi:preprotein translocase subunit YajC